MVAAINAQCPVDRAREARSMSVIAPVMRSIALCCRTIGGSTRLYYTWPNWNFKLTCETVGNKGCFLASHGVPDSIQSGAPRLYTFGAEVKF
jgi:hypothetical protein